MLGRVGCLDFEVLDELECNALDSVALHCRHCDASVPSGELHMRQAAACNLLIRTCSESHSQKLRYLD